MPACATSLPSLVRYAAEHRDLRNIALHCWGVPMVWLGLIGLAMARSAAFWPWALLLSGSLLQALGHVYEGRRPSQGVGGWLLAPLFVGLQGAHALGLGRACWAAVEQGAGPRRLRDLAA